MVFIVVDFNRANLKKGLSNFLSAQLFLLKLSKLLITASLYSRKATNPFPTLLSAKLITPPKLILLLPAYKESRDIEDAIFIFQDSFKTTDWQLFLDALDTVMNEYTITDNDYIIFQKFEKIFDMCILACLLEELNTFYVQIEDRNTFTAVKQPMERTLL